MRKLYYAIAFTALIGLPGIGTAAISATAAHAHHQHITVGDNCLAHRDEVQLTTLETQSFGSDHAAEHARARAERCTETSEAPQANYLSQAWQPLQAFFNRAMAQLNRLLIQITVPANAATGLPAQVGQWSAPTSIPVNGIATVLLPTSKVLFWTYSPARPVNGGIAYIWNPADGTGRRVDPPNNLWCAGQILLGDGRVLVVGGNLQYGSTTTFVKGLNQIYIFNPFSEKWIRQPDMRHGRWYPTVTLLADGRAVITSGLTEYGDTTIDTDVEVFTPSADLNGVGTVTLVGVRKINGLYPHQFLLPTGKMLLAGPGVTDSALLTPGTWTWALGPRLKQPRYGYGSGVLLPGTPGGSTKVMLIGGASRTGVFATTETLDTANLAAGWQFRAPLPQPRRNNNSVLLPDGTLLTLGGNNSVQNYTNPQYEAVLYNPATNIWTRMASQVRSRAYHSTAVLLPDARVISAGDDGPLNGGAMNEIFSPPYLFRGARPVITAAPATVAWKQSFVISTPSSVTKAVLIAPGATTHGNDMSQRLVPLAITPTTGGITAVAPPSANVAPPGYYMLFVLDSQGVPSVAKWIQLRR
ncbi:MAG TPA: galactose oxidase-like domain-containing protein [Gammaproteobacteria bacterium]|nr:galactose oxidase-like domain-containing protein [Gammaproteobacteria bacterium]